MCHNPESDPVLLEHARRRAAEETRQGEPPGLHSMWTNELSPYAEEQIRSLRRNAAMTALQMSDESDGLQ